MSNVDFAKGDDLADFLGGEAPSGQTIPAHTLPMDEASVRIRETVPDFTETCPACKGTGTFKSWAGRTVGQCFKCKGKGKRSFKTSPETRKQATQNYANRKDANWASFAERNPMIAEWIIRSAPRFDFAANMRNAVMTYGDLTANQLAACQKGVVRDAEYTAKREAAKSAPAPVQSFVNIKASFDALLLKGVRKAQMTVGNVELSLAPLSGKNPGQVYVKDSGNYVGKIVNGSFQSRNASSELVAALVEIERDPRAAVIAHAKMTAERIAAARAQGDEQFSLPCGCCGKMLTDPVSVNRGIGPICAQKWDY